MPIRNLEEVYVPKGRVRREIAPAELEELIKSILEVGLLNPPVVEADGALLAGERRFRALQEIAKRGLTYHSNSKFIRPGLIQTTDIRELSKTQRLQAEIEENTIRVDLSWQEKADAIANLHALRNAQKIEIAHAENVEPTPQLPAETAAEVRGKPLAEVTTREIQDTRNDLIVSAWLTAHPEDESVVRAKTRGEALKIIERQLEDEHRAALAKRFLRARPDSGHILRQVDMCVALIDTPASVYDVIITDPPWGAGAHQWQNGTSLRRHTYTDDLHTFERIHECLAIEGYRVAKERAHLYLFCAFQHFESLSRRFISAGWDVWPRPLIWWHGSQGIPPRPEHGPKNTYECILYAIKGNKRTLALYNDVIYALKQGDDDRAAAKPVSIYYDLLRRSVLPGDEVLDPCCGSGPVIPASNALKVRATCYDIADDAIGLASQRLTEEYRHTDALITMTGGEKRVGQRR